MTSDGQTTIDHHQRPARPGIGIQHSHIFNHNHHTTICIDFVLQTNRPPQCPRSNSVLPLSALRSMANNSFLPSPRTPPSSPRSSPSSRSPFNPSPIETRCTSTRTTYKFPTRPAHARARRPRPDRPPAPRLRRPAWRMASRASRTSESRSGRSISTRIAMSNYSAVSSDVCVYNVVSL